MISDLAFKIADTLMFNNVDVHLTGGDDRIRLAAIIESAGNLRNLVAQGAGLRKMAMMYGNDVESKISDLEAERANIIESEGPTDSEDCRDVDDRLNHWRATRRIIMDLVGEMS